MVNKPNKLWAHYEQLRTIFGIYITLFVFIPFCTFCFSFLAYSSDIEGGVHNAVKLALLGGLKWYIIIMPIVTMLFAVWFICYSDRVEFTENAISYYRWIFSKRKYDIPFQEITECVFNDGLWRHKGEYVRGRKILIYNKDKVILKLDLYYKLCISIIVTLKEKKVFVIGDNRNIQTISKLYSIDFDMLTKEQQIKILKHYCKLMKSDKRDVNKILK